LQDEGFSKTKGSDFLSSEKRYPVKRTVYTQTVGGLLPVIVGQTFLQLGASQVWINKGQGNNIDIKVWNRKGNLIIAGEILNWSIKSRLPKKRRRKIISNLKHYNCNKVLIYTNLNKKHLPQFSFNKISQVNIRYQVLPRRYYRFFKKKGQTIRRKPTSLRVSQDIKSKIKKYLKRRKISI